MAVANIYAVVLGRYFVVIGSLKRAFIGRGFVDVR